MIKCPRCTEPKPETEFYVSRARASGYTTYCRAHHQERVRHYRQSAGYKQKQAKRKPNVKAIPMWRMKISAREKVLMCYRKGITDRDEIRQATRLLWDEVCDLICELADERLIRFDHKRKRYQAA